MSKTNIATIEGPTPSPGLASSVCNHFIYVQRKATNHDAIGHSSSPSMQQTSDNAHFINPHGDSGPAATAPSVPAHATDAVTRQKPLGLTRTPPIPAGEGQAGTEGTISLGSNEEARSPPAKTSEKNAPPFRVPAQRGEEERRAKEHPRLEGVEALPRREERFIMRLQLPAPAH